ncbi:stage II sporulation protein D [Brevibacillus dissolubilis]|uniref:stage II sporulation protein D n=1 Tax=Brevibacillus dissolubilis TaxID=1844116 RepID=UPI001115F2D8|nr:stage II sporulation protein D [Brevibacillus dissolubilis]
MKRYVLSLLVILPILLVLIPAALVIYQSPVSPVAKPVVQMTNTPVPEPVGNQIPVKVYRTSTKKVDTVPLETYIEGVVSAEMPAEFELEALKAQAMAARTYIVRRIQQGKFDDVPAGAHVFDTVKHQAYLDEAERQKRWGSGFEWKQKRIQQAVRETAGMVLTYQGEPIDATFFSTSNGFTENSEEYWSKSIPYLKSVASPWDIQSPRYEEQVTLTLADLEQKLGVNVTAATSGGAWYDVIERTTGNRIGKIRIGDKEFSGKQIREKLGLNSTSFTMRLNRGQVTITTQGYGHGVGMSQWGANGMAKAGKKAEQIVKYFYQGISLTDYKKII